jgi:hypothetical protein
MEPGHRSKVDGDPTRKCRGAIRIGAAAINDVVPICVQRESGQHNDLSAHTSQKREGHASAE